MSLNINKLYPENAIVKIKYLDFFLGVIIHNFKE